MPEPAGQSPSPSNGNAEGTDIRSAANAIEGLLSTDAAGQMNIGDGRMSRAHPDYDDTLPHDQQTQRDTKGRFTKKAAKPDQTDGQQNVGDDDDSSAEQDQSAAGDDENEDTETGDTDDQLADSADQQAEQTDAETGDQITNVAEMAEALEMTVDEFMESMTDTFGAAGDETTVTLSEMRKGYQKDADYRRQTGKLADDRRAAETDYSTRMGSYDEQNRYLANHLTAAEQFFTGQLDDSGLASLRVSDPAEWTARREEIGMNLNQIRQARDHATQQYVAFQAQQQLDLKGREMSALQSAIPDFKSEVHGDQARKIMSSIGYTPAETAKIFDHRIVLAAIELGNLRTEVETLRAEKTKATDTVRRVTKEVPQLLKPGKQQPQGKRISRNNVEKLSARAKKSGTLEDAAAVISNMNII